jgi:hypothetical protein
MLSTKVERAADPIAISTVKGTRVLRCRSIRNAVPQRSWGFDWQDDLACADFSSDFDRLRPAAPRRRGCLRLRGAGRNLR